MNAFTLDDNYLSKFVFLLYSVLVAPLFPVLLHQLYRTDSSVVALFSSSFYFIFIFICIDRYIYIIHLEDFKSFVGCLRSEVVIGSLSLDCSQCLLIMNGAVDENAWEMKVQGKICWSQHSVGVKRKGGQNKTWGRTCSHKTA